MGRVHQISVSGGGVPKLAVAEAEVRFGGVVGDDQRDRKHHGGPERAVCLFSMEVIERLRAEGHPIAPGTVGENLTVSGLDWRAVAPGTRLVFERGVELEVAAYTSPCSNIRQSFSNLDSKRIKQDLHPGESRVYARVLREGRIAAGEGVEAVGPVQGSGRG